MSTSLANLSKTSLHHDDHTPRDARTVPLDIEHEGREGYILDAGMLDKNDEFANTNLKLAKDGHTVLIPQPSDDPRDPLNWSWFKKHAVLLTISFIALLPDFGSAVGAVILVAQGEEWNMSPNTVNHSQSGNVFMLGAGGYFAIIFSGYFGRLPTVFWFMLIAFATSFYLTFAPDFNNFMAARILNGFFSTVTQGGGLMFIKDMFFFHEHARKINIWSGFFILSPYLGPFAAGFIVNVNSWRWTFGMYTILTGLAYGFLLIFGDETYYDRSLPVEKQPSHGSHIGRLIGTAQWSSRHARISLWGGCLRFWRATTRIPVAVMMIYYMCTFAWVIGINTTLSLFLTPEAPAGYGFSTSSVSLFYFTPMIGAVLGELFGHFFNDYMAKRYIRLHHGHFEPEARLWAMYLGELFILPGLIISGFALEKHWHWAALAVGWGMFVFGVMINTVALLAYLLDCYPEASGEIAANVNMGRTIGGFIISYFQVEWAQKSGADMSFGIQAAISAAVFGAIVVLQIYGRSLRNWSGPLRFDTIH
ncbi:major facilitator superfamily domain-containing protein [Kockiozyma suomiensis]|uniref:major facilitator superfamily domain-containing protein n=1 Tax=Kockiozyma suomiensis TaxID=1337062 RepID=UPI003343991D